MSTQAIPIEKERKTTAKTMAAFVMHGIGKVGFMEKPLIEDPVPMAQL